MLINNLHKLIMHGHLSFKQNKLFLPCSQHITVLNILCLGRKHFFPRKCRLNLTKFNGGKIQFQY